MSKRGPGPTLYDLIHEPSSEKQGAGSRRRVDPDQKPVMQGPEQGWLSPGKVITTPVGYMLVAAAVIVTLIIVSYVLGYQFGVKAEFQRLESERVQDLQQGEHARMTADPLNRTDDNKRGMTHEAEEKPSFRPENNDSDRDQPSSAASRTPDIDERGWTAIDNPQRVHGKRYFILATTRSEGALRLAEFCRDRGLEAYVIQGNNTELFQVIALPGLDSGDTDAAHYRALKARIIEVGQEWVSTGSGESDLRDAYTEIYQE